jgi:hypothetical protein
VITRDWTIVWNSQRLDITSKRGLKHTVLCGDPHIMTDGAKPMDFPTATCSFVLTDGTLIVAEAPQATQPLAHVHVFTDDGQHMPLGTSQQFDDVIGTVFLQQDDGVFFAVVSHEVGTTNPNPVYDEFKDVL